ncbi:hypothetical protein Hanom_Chr09g00855031 [Helianthus anomalus]
MQPLISKTLQFNITGNLFEKEIRILRLSGDVSTHELLAGKSPPRHQEYSCELACSPVGPSRSPSICSF